MLNKSSPDQTIEKYADEVMAEHSVVMVNAYWSSNSLAGACRCFPFSKTEKAPPIAVGYAGGKHCAKLFIQDCGIPAMIILLLELFGSLMKNGFLVNVPRANMRYEISVPCLSQDKGDVE